MDNVKLISKSDVQNVLSMKKAIEIVEKVYQAHGREQVNMPAKITLDTGESNDWPPYGGSYNAMPAYVGGDVDISNKMGMGIQRQRQERHSVHRRRDHPQRAQDRRDTGHNGRKLHNRYKNRSFRRCSGKISLKEQR